MTQTISTPYKKPGNQKGASLFIALIILLVVTLLALSSVREVALETRITGNFIEQQKLSNSAESGLRDGENSVTTGIKPLEPKPSCTEVMEGTQLPACLLTIPSGYSYSLRFGQSRIYLPKDGTLPDSNTTIRWYGLPAPSGGEDGEAENPEYGSMFTGNAIFRYEVNSQAINDSTSNVTTLRSTTAKLFDNGN